MTSSQSKRRTEIQPVPERGFAGRAPLISGMLAKRNQLMASALMLKIADRAKSAHEAEQKYSNLIFRLAKGISESRRSKRISAMITDAISDVERIPQTKREALEMALKKKGVEAEIVDEKEAANFSMFKVSIGGVVRIVPSPNNIMEGDAVANFEKILGSAGIAGNSRELMELRKKEHGSFRPPTGPIEVELELLEKRKISYDGDINGQVNQFTYYAEAISTSFGVPADLKDGELLAEIDRRIVGLHETYGAPLDAEVVEQQASEKRKYRVPSDGEIQAIANAIHYLVEKGFESGMIPEEYAEAIEKLRSSEEYVSKKTALPISTDDGREFAEAFRQLDSPAHIMVRMLHPHFCGENGELNEEGKEIVLETLKLGEKENVKIESAALANIAATYSILTGRNIMDMGEDELRKKHLAIMFTIRTKMKEMTGNLVFRPPSA